MNYTELYYNVLPRYEWGEGPWSNEPDKAVWVDPATGFDAMIVRNYLGALCGYVGIPESHPWFGIQYHEAPECDHCDDVCYQHSLSSRTKVHGSLTYSDGCSPHPGGPGYGICHLGEGRPEVWWLGFDCADWGDLIPEWNTQGLQPHGVSYRSFDYLHQQVTSLANQLGNQPAEVIL